MKSRPDFLRFGDAFGRNAESLADGQVIGKNLLGILGVAEEGVASVAGEEAVFPLHDHSEVLVIDDDGLGGNVFGHGGGELLNVHEEGAVAVDVDDLAVGAGHLGADGGGIAVAHGDETCGGQETAGMMEVVELARPHLVLTDPGGDDGFALGQAAELLDHLLGHDPAGYGRVGKRVFLSPALDFFPPFLETFGQVGVGALGEKLVEVPQRKPDIGEDGKMHDFVFVEFGGVDVDMHDGGLLGELGNLAGDAVIKADAEGQEKVGIVHRIVGIHRAVHAEPFEGLGIVTGKQPTPMRVVVTGMPVDRANLRRSASAPEVMIPPPT